MASLLDLVRHVLHPHYLYAVEPEPLRPVSPGQLVAVLIVALLASLACWLARRRATQGRSAWPARWSCYLLFWSGILMALRPLLAGPLTARVWYVAPLAAAVPLLLAVLLPGAHRVGRWLTGARRTVAGTVALLFLHALGLGALTAYGGLWPWLPLVALGAVVLASALDQRRGWRRLDPSILTPLFFPYVTLALLWLLGDVLGVPLALYRAFPHADPWSPWFELGVALPVALLGVGLLLVRRVSRATGWRLPRRLVAGVALVALTGLYLGLTARHLSHGVTGSDPYCYLQMAADLVERGTVLHRFALAGAAREANVPTWPVVHVGYHPPRGDLWAATVWPAGWPLLLALPYALGGEAAALWLAPLCTLFSAGAVVLLAREVVPDEQRQGVAVGLVAAWLLLTSQEAFARALVPMADAAAQLFTVATLLALARARRHDRLAWSALAGLALALAYGVRHPQLPLALSALVLVGAPWPWRRRAAHLAAFGAVALLGALPDLAYHHQVFGAVWHTESPEWFLLSPRFIPATVAALVRDGWLRPAEFGYLWPFLFYGLWRSVRARRGVTGWLLLPGTLGVLFFALSYSALRLRDLIALFPILALWAAWGLWGAVDAARRAFSSERLRAGLLMLVVLMTLTARAVAWAPLSGGRVRTFGHLSPAERAALDALDGLLPADAVVGAGLNSGAIERYTGNQTVRPAYWRDDELARFVQVMAARGRYVYLLDEGEEMAGYVARLQADQRAPLILQEIARLPLSTMGRGGQPLYRHAILYRLSLP